MWQERGAGWICLRCGEEYILKRSRGPSVLMGRSHQRTMPATKADSISHNREQPMQSFPFTWHSLHCTQVWALQHTNTDKGEHISSKPTEMGQGLKHFPCEKQLSKPGLLEPKEEGASREELTAHPQFTRKTAQQGAACTERLSSLHPWRFWRCTGKRPEKLNLNSTWSLLSGEGYTCGPPKVPFNLSESDLCLLSPLLWCHWQAIIGVSFVGIWSCSIPFCWLLLPFLF